MTHYGLTFRDLTVLRCIAQGMNDEDIASFLNVNPDDARQHVCGIIDKMGAPSRYEAAVRALREGLIGPGELPDPVNE